jgi:hypothetical protein
MCGYVVLIFAPFSLSLFFIMHPHSCSFYLSLSHTLQEHYDANRDGILNKSELLVLAKDLVDRIVCPSVTMNDRTESGTCVLTVAVCFFCRFFQDIYV